MYFKLLKTKRYEVKSERDLHLSDTILDVYFPIIIKEEISTLSSVLASSVESIVLNYIYESKDMLKYGLKHFCEHRVEEKDIVFFPLIYNFSR